LHGMFQDVYETKPYLAGHAYSPVYSSAHPLYALSTRIIYRIKCFCEYLDLRHRK
jgi:hypothetical protein